MGRARARAESHTTDPTTITERAAHRAGPPPSAARHDWGWIELLTVSTVSPRGRGHLFGFDLATDGTWRATLESLRTHGDAALAGGRYIARFERGSEYQHVTVVLRDGTIEVRGDDGVLPAIALELAEGE